MIQSLEPRRLLAVIDTTNSADVIRLFVSGGVQHVEVNGFDLPVPDSSNTINALGGNDSVIVAGTRAGSTIVVNGGEGNDQLSNTLTDLDAAYLATFTFHGEGGSDTVLADNATDSTTPADITIQPEGIVKNLTFPLGYRTIEHLRYTDSLGSNRIGLERSGARSDHIWHRFRPFQPRVALAPNYRRIGMEHFSMTPVRRSCARTCKHVVAAEES